MTLARSGRCLLIPFPESTDRLPVICRRRLKICPKGPIRQPTSTPHTLSRDTMISSQLYRRNVQTVPVVDFLCISTIRVHKLSTGLSTTSVQPSEPIAGGYVTRDLIDLTHPWA